MCVPHMRKVFFIVSVIYQGKWEEALVRLMTPPCLCLQFRAVRDYPVTNLASTTWLQAPSGPQYRNSWGEKLRKENNYKHIFEREVVKFSFKLIHPSWYVSSPKRYWCLNSKMTSTSKRTERACPIKVFLQRHGSAKSMSLAFSYFNELIQRNTAFRELGLTNQNVPFLHLLKTRAELPLNLSHGFSDSSSINIWLYMQL